MAIYWPAGLDCKPVLDAFKVIEATRTPVSTEFEDGPALSRRSGTHRRAKLGYRIVFETPDSYNRFKNFHEYELIDGTSRFLMQVYLPHLNGYGERLVQIEKGAVQAETFGLGFAISFTLIVYDW